MKNYSIKIKKKFTIFSSLIRSHIISLHIKLTLAKDDSRKLRDRDGVVLIDIETKIKWQVWRCKIYIVQRKNLG